MKNTADLSGSQSEPAAVHVASLPSFSAWLALPTLSTRCFSPPRCICPLLPEVRYHASCSLLSECPFQGPHQKELSCCRAEGPGSRVTLGTGCLRTAAGNAAADLCGTAARCVTPPDSSKSCRRTYVNEDFPPASSFVLTAHGV